LPHTCDNTTYFSCVESTTSNKSKEEVLISRMTEAGEFEDERADDLT
jgi:hypothetical protein